MPAVTYFGGALPRLFAHRGASGSAPENTMVAFRAGVAAGATHLELDVHGTRDGRIVVLHDATLDRTTDARGAVRDRDWARVGMIDAGARFVDARGHKPYAGYGVRIPALEDVLAEFPEVPLNVEIKQAEPSIVPAVVALLERFRAVDRVLLAAESQAIMTEIRQSYRGPTGFSADEVLEFYRRSIEGDMAGYQPVGAALQVPPSHEGVEVVTARFVADAHRVHVEVHVWTINDAAETVRLLGLGVDGIMSDVPSLVAEAMARA